MVVRRNRMGSFAFTAGVVAAFAACSSDPIPGASPDAGADVTVVLDATAPEVVAAPPVLDDGGPGCGRKNQACCEPPVRPAEWSRDGEVCLPGYSCQAGVCRSTEIGRACATNAECPSGACIDVGGGKRACTVGCERAEDCTAGWSCGAVPGQNGSVCTCTVGSAGELCNGKDDDCNGQVDELREAPDCVQALGSGSRCCAGSCKAFQTDAQNCGACGRDCLGGSCTSGQCGAVAMTRMPAQVAPLAYTADAQSFYFAGLEACTAPDGGAAYRTTVLACPPSGCQTSTPLYQPPCGTLPNVSAMTSDGAGKLYWAASPSEVAAVGAILTSPGGVTVLDSAGATPLQRIGAMVFDSSAKKLYFGDKGGNVRRCEPATCAATLETLVNGQPSISALAVDATHFYFATRGAGGLGSVASCPKSGCVNGAPAVLASGELDVDSMAVENGRVYWGSLGIPVNTNASLSSCPNVAGCTPIRRATQAVGGIVVDGTYVYYSELGEGVVRVSQSDVTGRYEIITRWVSLGSGIGPLASDGKVLFFHDQGLKRVTK
jgi:hypothetical protein